MNIELVARQAVDIIKSRWGLPQRGFIAGGSIANIIWEICSGNKAIVNDIDIFIFDKFVDKIEKSESLFGYEEKDLSYYEDYGGVSYTSKTKDFYSINRTEIDDIFNSIYYESNTKDPFLVLKSFDINCTKIGYSIDEDKIYWTKEFDEFIKTGNLKICNLFTPSHSAIRLAKKSDELNIHLNNFELKLIEYSLSRGFSDTIKVKFKDKYYNLFNKYIDVLSPFFKIRRDIESELYLKNKYEVETNLWTLDAKSIDIINISDIIAHNKIKRVFEDDNLDNIYRSSDFLFYMRYIFGDIELSNLWKDLSNLWCDVDYIDKEVDKQDINLLSKFAKYSPGSINNLRGLKLSEQISFIKKFLNKFKDDPIIAISILENLKIDKDIELDDQTSLILELSVRKKILCNNNSKAHKILNSTGESGEAWD